MHQLLRYFNYSHLSPNLQEMVKPFAAIARDLAVRDDITDGAEAAVAIRKLLEAKDAAVRSIIPIEASVDAPLTGGESSDAAEPEATE